MSGKALQKISQVFSEQEFIRGVELSDSDAPILFHTNAGRGSVTLSEARIVVTIHNADNSDNWLEWLVSSKSTEPLLPDVRVDFFNSAGDLVDRNDACRIDIQSGLFDIRSETDLQSAIVSLIWGIESIVGSILATRDFREGREISVVSKRYERSSALRERAIMLHGLTCSICGFNFQSVYGELGENFIHVHHIDRVADSGVRVVDAASDLIPICPNCHSMIHRETPPMNPETLRRIVQENKHES